MTKIPDSYLTVSDVAKELEMSRDGVYKLIRRGKLRAVRVSERKMYVPRLVLDAYRRRLNGEMPDTRRPRSSMSVPDLRQEFEREIGYSPEDWIAEWKRERIEDSAENMQLLVRAVALRIAPEQRKPKRTRRPQAARKASRQPVDAGAKSRQRKVKAGSRRKRAKQPS